MTSKEGEQRSQGDLPIDFLSKQIEKSVALLGSQENRLARVAARGHVVKRTGKFETQRTSHASSMVTMDYKVQA